mgnify:FL=1|tara:strand:+ start:1724 stop:2287 length:564 start_codon:yes stop_codon:yes gene_type:complete
MKTIAIIQEWIMQIQEQHNLSLREWALKAAVDPSTLQKFMKHGTTPLSTTVLSKLGNVVNSYPKLDKISLPLDQSYPVYEVVDNELKITVKRIPTMEAHGNKSYWVLVQWDSMNLRGFITGEYILVDPEQKPNKGDIVLIKNREEFCIYEYNQPYLVSFTSKPEQYPTIDVALIDVLGVVKEKRSSY